MRQVFGSVRATVLDRLQELLNGRHQNAITEADVVDIVTNTLKANINTTKYLMSDLGWIKSAVKWGGVDYARQLWVRPGYVVDRGRLKGPEGFDEPLAKHLGQEMEIIRGQV